MLCKSSGMFLLIGVLVAAVGCADQPSAPTPTPAPLVFDGAAALRHVEAQIAFGPRPTGSEAAHATAEYIQAQLVSSGWEPRVQEFVYQDVQGQNIYAVSSRDERPVILLGAHFDTRRQADQDSTDALAPVLGANDGASGVAVLLELARVLDLERVQSRVVLAFFDAEDNGRLDGWDWIVGSRLFASSMDQLPVYVIIVDMVGDEDQQLYYESNSDPALRAALWQTAADLGFSDQFIPEERHSLLDDHTAFIERGIPAVDIIDFDYPYWHTTEDTLDKVSAASLMRVGRVLEKFLEEGGAYPGY